MNYQVIFSPGAEADLQELEDYLAVRFSQRNADKFVSRLIGFCAALGSTPYCGTARDDILPGLRTAGFERKATIAFRVKAETIGIAGIFYGGRNLRFEP